MELYLHVCDPTYAHILMASESNSFQSVKLSLCPRPRAVVYGLGMGLVTGLGTGYPDSDFQHYYH